MNYRYDLDCLRGVAMFLVFIYHYNKILLPSGYIGVDIFFILSGYVNTLSNKKNFTLEFFTKRIVRLYPQQIVCLFFVYTKLNIKKQVNYESEMSSIISSLLGYSNYHFYFISVDYLQSSASPSNVLHFWSLSLENQYYLLFPLLSYIFQYIRIYGTIYILLIVIGLYESIYYSKLAYYSLFSRINEFMFGTLLSLFQQKRYYLRKDFFIIFIIIISRIDRKWVNLSFPLPFLFIVEPLLSYIFINSLDNNIILNSKIMNYLGRISYSFYLYHYPILNFIFDKNYYNMLYTFLFVLFLSVLTTYVVERPIRNSKYKNIISVVIIIIIGIFTFALIKSRLNYRKYISSFIHNNNKSNTQNGKIKNNSSSYMIQSPFDVNYDWECKYYFNQCWCPFFNNNNKHNEKYMYDNIFASNVLFLIGDSHLEQWSYIIYPYAHEKGYTLLELYSNLDYINSGNYIWLYDILKKFKNKKYAVISNHIHTYGSRLIKKYTEEIANMFELIYIIQDTPQFNYDPNDCLIQNKNKLKCYGILGRNATIIKYPIINNRKLFYVDMNENICENGKCPFIFNGYPVYKDNHHLNLNYTYFLKEYFFNKGFKLDKIDNPSNEICKTAIWCRRDYGPKNLNCRK